MTYQKIEVGLRLSPKHSKYPEGCDYNYYQNTHELRLFFNNPTQDEIRAVRYQKAEFGLLINSNVLILLFRFGQLPWSDAPYSWHMVSERERTLPGELEVCQRSLLSIILVNAADGIVKGLRLISLSPEFSVALNSAIRDQTTRKFDQSSYDLQLEQLYQEYPSSAAMLEAAQLRCEGGK